MAGRIRVHASTVIAVVLAAVLVAPPIARAVGGYDADNADKVDGRHAVAASTSSGARAGKLVATNATGRLPNDIIAMAPNSDRLDGRNSSAYELSRTVRTFRVRLSTVGSPTDSRDVVTIGRFTFSASCIGYPQTDAALQLRVAGSQTWSWASLSHASVGDGSGTNVTATTQATLLQTAQETFSIPVSGYALTATGDQITFNVYAKRYDDGACTFGSEVTTRGF